MAREVWVGEADPGQWYPVDFDDERQVTVSMRVRPLDDEIRKEAMDKFGKVFKNKRTRTKQKRIPDALSDEASYFYAMKMWTDTKNFFVRLGNDNAVEFFKKHLLEQSVEKRQQFSVGLEFSMDGLWTDELRDFFLRKDVRYLNVVTETGLLLDTATAEEEELQEN